MSYFTWTGNPFVDCGISVVLEWCDKKEPDEITPEDLSSIGSLLPQVYTSAGWRKNLYSIFVNYPPNQAIYRTEEEKESRLQGLLAELLCGVEPLGEEGDCIACGARFTRKRRRRMHIPLTGSCGAINYFSFGADGADYCDSCAFAVQCSPLAYYACGKLIMLHSDSRKVMRYWARRAIQNLHREIASDNFVGCFNEGYTNPLNALFHITQNLILTYEERWSGEEATVRLYHFTNYAQCPALDIYDLPAPVFRFLAEVRSHPHFRAWRRIVRRGYYFRRGEEKTLHTAGKAEEDYKNSKNRVYSDLVAGRSILHRFLNLRTRTAYGDYSFVGIYLREILAMDTERIETIKRVADEIARYVMESPDGKRRLRGLETAVKFRDFCSVLRRICLGRAALGAPAPLFTLDEFAEKLFPEGALSFVETRYLILFRLYEQLHDWLLAQALTVEEEDDKVEGPDDPAEE